MHYTLIDLGLTVIVIVVEHMNHIKFRRIKKKSLEILHTQRERKKNTQQIVRFRYTHNSNIERTILFFFIHVNNLNVVRALSLFLLSIFFGFFFVPHFLFHFCSLFHFNRVFMFAISMLFFLPLLLCVWIENGKIKTTETQTNFTPI